MSIVSDLEKMYRPQQLEMYKRHTADLPDLSVVVARRGWGKSYFTSLVVNTLCYANDQFHAKLLSPTQKMQRAITLPAFNQILADIDPELRPHFKAQDSKFEYDNFSTATIYATDLGQEDSSRGTGSNFAGYDEAGFCKNLRYIYESVIGPRLSLVGGTSMMVSTPPLSSRHPFVKFARDAQKDGTMHKFPADKDPDITLEMFNKYAKICGGVDSVTFRREYLCEFITDLEYALFPEFIQHDGSIPSCSLDSREEMHQGRLFMILDVNFAGVTGILNLFVPNNSPQVIVMRHKEMKGATFATLANEIKGFSGRVYGFFDFAGDAIKLSQHAGLRVIPILTPPLSGGLPLLRQALTDRRLHVLDRNSKDSILEMNDELKGVIFNEARKQIADIEGSSFAFSKTLLLAASVNEIFSGGRGNVQALSSLTSSPSTLRSSFGMFPRFKARR